MTMKRTENGDTLIEILSAVVILGIVVSALLAAIATNETGTVSHRNLVTADHVLRNYAETVKSDARAGCITPGAVWTSSYVVPSGSGYAVNSLSAGTRTCPAVTATQRVDLTVTLPNSSTTKSLSLAVRTP